MLVRYDSYIKHILLYYRSADKGIKYNSDRIKKMFDIGLD